MRLRVLYSTLLAVLVPTGHCTLKVLVLRLLGLMGLLNVAVMRVLTATPVTTGLLAKGAVADTLGVSASSWSKPKMGSLLPPQAVTRRKDVRASIQEVVRVLGMKVRMKGLLYRCCAVSKVVCRFDLRVVLHPTSGRQHGLPPVFDGSVWVEVKALSVR
jgi:hypothetical protein